MKEKIKQIALELKHHAPFTMFGALIGIILMLIFENSGKPHSQTLFSIFHPLHVVLSGMVTAAIFEIHSQKKKNIFLIILIGYVGAIGIATLSDSVMPWLGEKAFGLHIPKHSHMHENNSNQHHENEKNIDNSQEKDDHIHHDHDHHQQIENHNQNPKLHIGFIKEWYFVHPAAIIGAIIALFVPSTKFPHAGHVLISTWASSAHILMNLGGPLNIYAVAQIFVILFLATWLPCCVSDIIFPMLFTKGQKVSPQIHHHQ